MMMMGYILTNYLVKLNVDGPEKALFVYKDKYIA
jgi:hypothetical protein